MARHTTHPHSGAAGVICLWLRSVELKAKAVHEGNECVRCVCACVCVVLICRLCAGVLLSVLSVSPFPFASVPPWVQLPRRP